MELNKEQLEGLIKHMFNGAANIITSAERALPLIDATHYSKHTKDDIKIHLSADLMLSLGIVYPAIDFMKEHVPTHQVETLERWKKYHESLSKEEEKPSA